MGATVERSRPLAVSSFAAAIALRGASAWAQPYVVDLDVGSQLHQCAIMSDRTVRCRGMNYEGRLGNGRTNEPNVPATTVPGLTDVEQVITDQMGVTCARRRDGTVSCWGSNRDGLVGTGHAGDEDCHGAPCRMSPTVVPGLTGIVDLVDGNGSICAVQRDGNVRCWGSNRFVPGFSATPVATRLSDVAAMWPFMHGWVWRIRSGGYGADTPIPGLTIPAQAEIARGYFGYHLCYRLPDRTVRCLGGNSHGQVGNGQSSDDLPGVTVPANPGLRGVRSIATSATNTCAVLADRTVWCWGDGSHGALGAPPTEFCTGPRGSVACASRPRRVPGLTNVERVFVGIWGGCALRVDHDVLCWGTLAPDRNVALAPVAW